MDHIWQSMKPVWFDDFDGTSLDYSRWEVEVDAFGGGNHELQIYTDYPANVRVENSCLVLEAHRERSSIMGTVREYSSGRVRTKHRGDWAYGLFEARIKVPVGRGLWPAFWMLPTSESHGRWAASGEIDIMEHIGSEPTRASGALHFGGTWPNNNFVTSTTAVYPDGLGAEFRTFSLLWEKERMTWFVDGQSTWSVPRETWHPVSLLPGNPEQNAPFNQRFHLLLNLAVGGSLPGSPTEDTEFPARMLVDWVRVWQ